MTNLGQRRAAPAPIQPPGTPDQASSLPLSAVCPRGCTWRPPAPPPAQLVRPHEEQCQQIFRPATSVVSCAQRAVALRCIPAVFTQQAGQPIELAQAVQQAEFMTRRGRPGALQPFRNASLCGCRDRATKMVQAPQHTRARSRRRRLRVHARLEHAEPRPGIGGPPPNPPRTVRSGRHRPRTSRLQMVTAVAVSHRCTVRRSSQSQHSDICQSSVRQPIRHQYSINQSTLRHQTSISQASASHRSVSAQPPVNHHSAISPSCVSP